MNETNTSMALYPEQVAYYVDFARFQVEEPDMRLILEELSYHIGEENRVTVERLALIAYGKYSATTDRKVRDCLEALVDKYDIPVGAHSGKLGRWLIINQEERCHVQNELDSRAHNMLNKSRKLGRINLKPVKKSSIPVNQGVLW